MNGQQDNGGSMKTSTKLFLRCLWRYPLLSNHYALIAGILAGAILAGVFCIFFHVLARGILILPSVGGHWNDPIISSSAVCFLAVVAWLSWSFGQKNEVAESLAYPESRMSIKSFFFMPAAIFVEVGFRRVQWAMAQASAIASPGSSIALQMIGTIPLLIPGLVLIEIIALASIMLSSMLLTGFSIAALAAGHVSLGESGIFYMALLPSAWLAASIKNAPWRAIAAKRKAEGAQALSEGAISRHLGRAVKMASAIAQAPAELRALLGGAAKRFAGRVMEEAGKSEALSLAERAEISSIMAPQKSHQSKKPPRL